MRKSALTSPPVTRLKFRALNFHFKIKYSVGAGTTFDPGGLEKNVQMGADG
jgi:hypothetical protein